MASRRISTSIELQCSKTAFIRGLATIDTINVNEGRKDRLALKLIGDFCDFKYARSVKEPGSQARNVAYYMRRDYRQDGLEGMWVNHREYLKKSHNIDIGKLMLGDRNYG